MLTRYSKLTRLCLQLRPPKYNFCEKARLKSKSTRQIDQEIAKLKWKNIQNTYKSLNTTFRMQIPTNQQLTGPISKPDVVEYSLKSLRDSSHKHPAFLYLELANSKSPFHDTIRLILQNLWKAEKEEALQILQFLYSWDYRQIDYKEIYPRLINAFEFDLFELFKVLKQMEKEGEIREFIQIKVLERLRKDNLSSQQYGPLMKIINFFNLKNKLSEEFQIAVMNSIAMNINSISVPNVLDTYIYFTYTMGEAKETATVNTEIIKIIEGRLFAKQCLNFYKGDELVAILHTFLKNHLILSDRSSQQYYDQIISRVINRVQMVYVTQDFETADKIKLLKLVNVLPTIKKQTVIALVQNELLKKGEKFDPKLLVDLYLVSYEGNMLTPELLLKMQNGIIENIFQLSPDHVSRAAWLFVMTGAKNLKLLHSKMETIIEGGLKNYEIKEICIMVWSMSSANYNEKGKFWSNIEFYLQQQLCKEKQINECSWILWAYLNNRQLQLKTIDLISDIIIGTFAQSLSADAILSAFQLINIVGFYYSIELPSPTISVVIKNICFSEFEKMYKMMESVELCKVLKYMGNRIWRSKELSDGVLSIFEVEVSKINYNDLMSVIAVLLQSGIKSSRVTELIRRLLERKKQLESLEEVMSENGKRYE